MVAAFSTFPTKGARIQGEEHASLKFTHFPKKSMVVMAGDVGIITFSYVLSTIIWFGCYNRFDLVTLLTGISFLAAYIFIFYLLDFYSMDLVSQRIKYLFRHMTGVISTAGLLALSFFFWPGLKSGRGVFLIFLVLAGAGTYVWRLAFLSVYKKRVMRRQNILILGAGRAGGALYDAIRDNPGYSVVGFMTEENDVPPSSPVPSIKGGPAVLKQMISDREVNAIVLASDHFKDPELLKTALACKLNGTMVYDMPSFYEAMTGKVPVEHVTDSWLVLAPLLGVNRSMYNSKLKRALDIMLAFVGLVITLPLTLVLALAVKLDSQGTVLYRQRRVGRNGNVFTLYKFRSMQYGTDNDRQHAGEEHDPRITRVGKFMRQFRIDELPQMWNVLKGELSFIGPRALMEEEVREFESRIPYFSLRHSIRPGITGWAQVNYRHGVKIEDGLEKLQYDLFYIKNLSPFLDFRILLKTVKVVLSGQGAR
jgi:exopolysaccharide biosynthesis polyprenyl glycosylphosphotransferase